VWHSFTTRETRIRTACPAFSMVHPLRCHSPPWSARGVPAADGRNGTLYLRTIGGQQNYVVRRLEQLAWTFEITDGKLEQYQVAPVE
jgi:hypothetical protein